MRRNLSSLALVATLSATVSYAATIHVPADQPTIQAGIDAATPGDTVLVADGVYTGAGNRDIDFGGKNIVVRSENGAVSTIIDCQATESDRHRGFIFQNQEDTTAKLEGFTIENGVAPWVVFGSLARGGGISCKDFSNPTISDNIIRNNSAPGPTGNGGGINITQSNPIVRNNTIENNTSSFFGGGIFCNNAGALIEQNVIALNSSAYGGGIELSGGNPVVRDNQITDNTGGSGGGIRCDGPTALIAENLIAGNDANTGGGIYAAGGVVTISANRITENTAEFSGGGIDYLSPQGGIGDNIIDHNTARIGGGISVRFSSEGAVVSGNTIVSNIAWIGSGISLDQEANIEIDKCIIAFGSAPGNSPAQAVTCLDTLSVATVSCTDIYENIGWDWVDCIADQEGLNHNFSLDPLFCDTANRDYHIADISHCAPPSSPCGQQVGALGVGCQGEFICADANGDGRFSAADINFLSDYYFGCGPIPFPLLANDVNCDGAVNLSDILYLNRFIHGNGAAPCCF